MTTPSERSYPTYRCDSTKVSSSLQKCNNGVRTLPSEPPRSTAYYYADLERLKRKNPDPESANADELSEYVESNEVANDAPIREVPPLRDRQWSLPEYSTPENSRKGETYSTAGTFPMPETKEKEPLLAELEVVGRLPLTQLESSSGVRRSRSWYLCCPNVGEEEISRESSWRYSSLRPVTAPPAPGQNGLNGILVASEASSRTDDLVSLKAERDALARALAAERARAAAAARAHDARLAELHGVIAELVRRRAADKHAGAIPEEDMTDECESTTQPAGELDNDCDHSRTEQNESSSILSPSELAPQEKGPVPDDTDTSTLEIKVAQATDTTLQVPQRPSDHCDASLNLSERDSEICLSTARCCQAARGAGGSGGGGGLAGSSSADSCEREHGSDSHRVYTAEPERCGVGEAKVASRVRLRRTDRADSTNHLDTGEAWSGAGGAAEGAAEVCAHADLREALLLANHTGEALSASVCVWRARCARLEADAAVLRCALARAADTQHRLYCACAVAESWCVALCVSLRAADAALEAYDVLLALAEAASPAERGAAELVARQLLLKLERERGGGAALGEPLLSPGPWHNHLHQACPEAWSAQLESQLRGHAARLKGETASLRPSHPPTLFSYHDVDEDEIPKAAGAFNMADMEAAVMLQEVLEARERAAVAGAGAVTSHGPPTGACAHRDRGDSTAREHIHQEGGGSGERGRGRRHWLHTHPSETQL